MIFKIQKPRAGQMTDALVYNEDRSVLFQVPMSKDIRELFRNGELKVFHDCEIKADGIFEIGRRIKDPGW